MAKQRDHRASTRKIIDNKFHSTEIDTRPVTFELEAGYAGNLSEEDKIHFNLLFDEIHALVEDSEYKIFNKVDENNKVKKLNKIQINTVYNFIGGELPDYAKIDIFSVLSEYFDIEYVKFFNSLSNLFKEQLIMELDGNSNVLERKNVRKLF